MTISKASNKQPHKPSNLNNLFTFTTTTTTTSFVSSPCSPSESMMDETIKTAETIIHKWNIDSHSYSKFISIFHENTREANVFINCIKRLHKAMLFLASDDSKSNKLTVAQRLMQIAMKRLQKEFHLLLLNYNISLSVNHPSTFSITPTNLELIANTMISCGYGKECIEAYTIIRKSTIDEALAHLGIQPYTHSHIKTITNDPHFANHIKIWLKAVQIAVKTLFYDEKLLNKHVFSSHSAIGDLCFEKTTKQGAINLFMFPELVATRCNLYNKLKADRVFMIIELYNSISNLWPDIESIFSNESISSVKAQALLSLHKLSESVRLCIDKLVSSIQRNSSKITVSGGGIHPLNDSVMTYLSSIADYGNSDDLQCKQHSLFLKSYIDCFNTDEKSLVAVSATFACVIFVLLCKLDMKSKFHNYVALSYLFLANNMHFIIEKVRVTSLKFILGDEWIAKHEKKLEVYVCRYQSMSWNKVILCLPENSMVVVTPEKVKDCFRRLCATFEEVYGKQTSWIVVDETMRDKMKMTIFKELVPAYGEFYVKHLMTLSEDERCMRMLTRLSPDNMAKYLSGLFPGTSTVLRSSWLPHSSSIVSITKLFVYSGVKKKISYR